MHCSQVIPSAKRDLGSTKRILAFTLLLPLFIIGVWLLIQRAYHNKKSESPDSRRIILREGITVSESIEDTKGPSKTRSTKRRERTPEPTGKNPPLETPFETLKNKESQRLKSIKIVELDTEFKIHLVFDTPTPEEEKEIVEAIDQFTSTGLNSADEHFPNLDKNSLLMDFGITGRLPRPQHYLVVATIRKDDMTHGKYETTPINEGNLTYSEDDVPHAGILDYLNTPKETKRFSTTEGGRFSEVVEIR